MADPIIQDIHLTADRAAVFKALTDAASFAAFTGTPAEIDAAEGGAFSGFGGQVSGRMVELVPNERIVQAWRVGPWPEGTYSIVRFDLADHADGTTLTLTHDGFSADQREHLDGGWHKMYWEPLKAHLK